MSAAAALTLVAALLDVEAGVAVADRGRADGLRPGDRGLAHYTLYVGDDRRPVRVDAGRLEVIAVEERTARLSVPPGVVVRRGYSVELKLPADRGHSAADAIDEGPPPAAPEPASEPSMAPVAGGDYEVGTALAEAKFYNQSPRFVAKLRPYQIDRSPAATVGAVGWLTNLSFAEAEAHCRARGKRLPTEIEWEVAVAAGVIETAVSLFEWTRSWYRPYPGNRFPEEEYGETYRVLRGGPADPRTRHFMAPAKRRADVGFRCARADSQGSG